MTGQIYTPLYWTGKWLDRMSLCKQSYVRCI
ncbi:hypothetical protein J2W17_005169 [Pseudomonas lini]|nr:hypothetical protein [Pseudomonas lini]